MAALTIDQLSAAIAGAGHLPGNATVEIICLTAKAANADASSVNDIKAVGLVEREFPSEQVLAEPKLVISLA